MEEENRNPNTDTQNTEAPVSTAAPEQKTSCGKMPCRDKRKCWLACWWLMVAVVILLSLFSIFLTNALVRQTKELQTQKQINTKLEAMYANTQKQAEEQNEKNEKQIDDLENELDSKDSELDTQKKARKEAEDRLNQIKKSIDRIVKSFEDFTGRDQSKTEESRKSATGIIEKEVHTIQ